MKKQFWERLFQILDHMLGHFGYHCNVPWHRQALLGIRQHKNCSQSIPQRVSFFAFERQGRPEKQNGARDKNHSFAGKGRHLDSVTPYSVLKFFWRFGTPGRYDIGEKSASGK